MEIITVDGMAEHDFRHSVEDMLRLDQIDEAVERLRALLESCAGFGEVLPPRFLEVSSSDLEFVGWHRIADRVLDHDRPGRPISAIGVTLANSRALGGPGPSRGRLEPFIKTFYFSDESFPFSNATRDDLLDGYSRDGFEWQGDYQATDATLSIRGLDQLYGAIVELEDRLFASANPDESEIRAGTIGSCYLAALIHQSLRDTIRKKGLPRPLCVLTACDGVYPFFDAPVAGSDECTAEEQVKATLNETGSEEPEDGSEEDMEELAERPLGEASLLDMFSHRAAKAPVLVLCEADAREAAEVSELAGAQSLAKGDEDALRELLKGAHLANSEFGDDAAWLDPELFDYSSSRPGGSSATSASIDRAPLRDSEWSGEAPDAADHHALSRDDDGTFAKFAADEDVPEPFPIPFDESIVDEPELAEVPFTAPQSHRLRAQIRFADPVSTESGNGIWAIIDWLRRTILRR